MVRCIVKSQLSTHGRTAIDLSTFARNYQTPISRDVIEVSLHAGQLTAISRNITTPDFSLSLDCTIQSAPDVLRHWSSGYICDKSGIFGPPPIYMDIESVYCTHVLSEKCCT